MCSRLIVTILSIFGGKFVHFIAADSGLPVIQISHDELGEDYPEMQEQVQLEDFFWTGSGDGPPDYLKKVHTGISKGKEVIVKTETVVATVYVDGNNEVDIPICLDCLNANGGNGDEGVAVWNNGGMTPLNYSATDRRYWLLTVMSGFYTQKDNPVLEEKLARLYRLAFTRQQSRHLGLNGAQKIAGIAVSTGGRERRGHNAITASTTEKPPNLDVEILDMAGNDTLHTSYKSKSEAPHSNSEWETSSEEIENAGSTTESPLLNDALYGTTGTGTDNADVVTLAAWELIQQHGEMEKLKAEPMLDSTSLVPQLPAALNPLFRNDKVRVLIHNMTQITAEDVLSGNVPSNSDEDINSKIEDRPAANQTELIYSVFVNGRPVLAVTAANDMRLVTESEARTVIGKEIYMKAEPYLREPMATPLAPATHSGSVGFIDSLQNNTALVVVSTIAILLLLLLLVTLLLVSRAKSNEKRNEVNRTTSRNELLNENPSARPSSIGTLAIETQRSFEQSQQELGTQNISFENECSPRSREPRIHFPGPPVHDSRRSSFTSTDNTSDSSVYCPINPPPTDVQRMLDEKATKLFDRHKRRHHHQYDRAEGRDDTIYTTVANVKKPRHKRRYLSENRVGSLETSPVQGLANSSGDDMPVDAIDAIRNTTEAFNPHNNYHRNKLLHQKTVYNENTYDHAEMQATEAINKEIIRALQPSERSSDTGSIGSFLSMASVRAFPKSTHPEPLNRVLEPVFVTYYDNVDDSHPEDARKSKTKLKQQRGHSIPLDATTIATIENFPSPKAPVKTKRFASQSDNPDPGVVGPIVWERHKQRMQTSMENVRSNEQSPMRDPIATRNHYEGLLEGAIQMYSSQDDLPMPLPTRDFTNSRKPTKREYRGSSAGTPSYFDKCANADVRPSTAQPEKTNKSNHSTEPPSPTTSAWGGSIYSSNSTLVRPLSAGPFHRPAADDLSTAPLIEAIQQELRKFKTDAN